MDAGTVNSLGWVPRSDLWVRKSPLQASLCHVVSKESMESILVLREEKKAEFTCALCSVCFLTAQSWHGDLEGSGALYALALWNPVNDVSLKIINKKRVGLTRWLLNSFGLSG